MIIKEIFGWVLLSSLKMSVVVVLLLALTKPITKRYTAGFRYYSWLAVVIVYMIPFSKFGFTIDTTAATDSLQYWAREIIAELSPARKETAEVSAYVPTGETETVTAEDGAPIEVESREYVSGTVTYSEPVDILLIASIIWAIGAAVYFLAHIGGYMSFRRAAERISYVSDNENVNAVFCEELRKLDLRRAPTLVVSAAVCSPMLVGVVRPMLILSERDYTDEELHLVFRHELIHYRRHDILYQLILLIFTAVHWFNPFAYILSSAASADGETACDERVLAGEDADTRKFYALMLITLLKSQKTSRQNAAVSGRGYMTTTFFGGKNGMKKRLTLIMNTKIKRAGKAAMAVLTAFALTLSLTAAAASSGYFSSVFEGDTSYLADFIQTPRQSVSDDNYTLTVEQYLVSETAVFVVFSIEALNEDAAAQMHQTGKLSWGLEAVTLTPIDSERANISALAMTPLKGDFNTETKQYYMLYSDDFYNPERIDFCLSFNEMQGEPKIAIPMTENIETITCTLGDITVKYSPITFEFTCPRVNTELFKDWFFNEGNSFYFKMRDGSIKTISQLYGERGSGPVYENGETIGLYNKRYFANSVIEPGCIKSIIICKTEYHVNDSQEPFGVTENVLSCLEYPLDDTENPREFDLPDELRPFIVKPYTYADTDVRLPLREVCEHLGAEVTWDDETQSAMVKYNDSVYVIPNNSLEFTKDGETGSIYSELCDNTTFTDENGRMMVCYEITQSMGINSFMITTEEHAVSLRYSQGYDLSQYLMFIIP